MVGIFEKLDNFNIMDVSDAIDAALGIQGTLGVRKHCFLLVYETVVSFGLPRFDCTFSPFESYISFHFFLFHHSTQQLR